MADQEQATIRQYIPFAMVYKTVIKDPRISSRGILVFTALSCYANQNGECWPGIKTAAAEVKIGVTRFREGLKELLDAGFVTRELRTDPKTGGQRSSIYTLHPAPPLRIANPPPPHSEPELESMNKNNRGEGSKRNSGAPPTKEEASSLEASSEASATRPLTPLLSKTDTQDPGEFAELLRARIPQSVEIELKPDLVAQVGAAFAKWGKPAVLDGWERFIAHAYQEKTRKYGSSPVESKFLGWFLEDLGISGKWLEDPAPPVAPAARSCPIDDCPGIVEPGDEKCPRCGLPVIAFDDQARIEEHETWLNAGGQEKIDQEIAAGFAAVKERIPAAVT